MPFCKSSIKKFSINSRQSLNYSLEWYKELLNRVTATEEGLAWQETQNDDIIQKTDENHVKNIFSRRSFSCESATDYDSGFVFLVFCFCAVPSIQLIILWPWAIHIQLSLALIFLCLILLITINIIIIPVSWEHWITSSAIIFANNNRSFIVASFYKKVFWK